MYSLPQFVLYAFTNYINEQKMTKRKKKNKNKFN